MKIRKLLVLSLISLLTSCGAVTSSSFSSESTYENSTIGDDSSLTSIDDNTSDITSSSEGITSDVTSSSSSTSATSDDTSSTEEVVDMTVQEAKALSLSLTNKNDVGIAISSTLVNIEAKMIFADTVIASSKYWNDDYMYKALIIDETGYMYASVSANDYEQLKKYQYDDTSYYLFTGYIANYIGMPEIKVTEYEWIKNHDDTITKSVITSFVSEEKSIAQIYQGIANYPINIKGVYLGNLTKFTGKYLAKMDDSVLLFTDGNNIIQLHGTNKIGNNFALNSVYTIYGVPSTYIYKPNFNYVCHEVSDKNIDINVDALSYMTATDLYKVTYTNDKAQHSTNYEKQFYSLYRFKGYANVYSKDSNQYVVFTDTYRDSAFSTYTTATNAKALFLKNESEIGLYKDSDFNKK